MRVTFFSALMPPDLASGRLRGRLIIKELEKYGIGVGKDIAVAQKHGWDLSLLDGFSKIIADVCDDHFDGQYGDHYRAMIELADAVTCNSLVMAERIMLETGRDAAVIPDPYEGEEGEPHVNETLLWFGHSSNYRDLERLKPRLDGYRLAEVSNRPGCIQWSPATMKAMFKLCGIVVIPTGKSLAKSGNRVIEALRAGCYVCAEWLPAYDEFAPYMGYGDIPTQIACALEDRERSIDKIIDGQDYIRDRFSPETIAKQWLKVLQSV